MYVARKRVIWTMTSHLNATRTGSYIEDRSLLVLKIPEIMTLFPHPGHSCEDSTDIGA